MPSRLPCLRSPPCQTAGLQILRSALEGFVHQKKGNEAPKKEHMKGVGYGTASHDVQHVRDWL